MKKRIKATMNMKPKKLPYAERLVKEIIYEDLLKKIKRNRGEI